MPLVLPFVYGRLRGILATGDQRTGEGKGECSEEERC